MSSDQEKKICPLCGAHDYVEPELSDDIKDAFLESMLGDVPFTRTYDVMNGHISITVQALTEDIISKKAKLYINLFKLSETIPDIKSYIPSIELVTDIDCQICQVSITRQGDNNPVVLDRTPGSGLDAVLSKTWDGKTAQEGQEYVDQILSILNQSIFPENAIPQQLLRGVVGKHNILTANLIKACLDENFLAGTGR